MSAALSIIVLLPKHVEVILIAIHEKKEKVSVLLVAGNEHLEITNCLTMRIDGERNWFDFVFHDAGLLKVGTTRGGLR
jgi:hypothetical protein